MCCTLKGHNMWRIWNVLRLVFWLGGLSPLTLCRYMACWTTLQWCCLLLMCALQWNPILDSTDLQWAPSAQTFISMRCVLDTNCIARANLVYFWACFMVICFRIWKVRKGGMRIHVFPVNPWISMVFYGCHTYLWILLISHGRSCPHGCPCEREFMELLDY